MLAALVALLWVGLTSAPASAANPAADLEQCRNGTFSSPQQCVGSAWQTGNAGASNSHYREGDSVPFRAKLINLSTSGSHTLVIQYDTIDSGAHAYDYLTSYNRTETTADPCLGISPCVAGASGAIPADGSIIFANPSSTQVPGSISIWNGSITSVAYGSSDPADKRSVIVTFTATNPTLVLAWGGHIASQIDWGVGNSASAISGSPYHMRLLDLDNDGLGNMDRSLSAASVAPVPANFTTQASAASITLGQSVTDLATLAGPNGTVSGNVAFFVCGPTLVSSPDCASGGSSLGSATLSGGQAMSAPYAPTLPGKYCFRAEYTPDLFAQYSPGHHTNLTTECFEVVQALGSLRVIKQVVNDSGGTKVAGDFTLHVKSGGTDVVGSPAAGSATGVVYTLAAGSYTVSEDTPPAGYAQTGFSGDCDSTGAVTIVPGMQKTCTITNDDQAAKLIVIKHVVNNEAGNKTAADFAMSVTGTTPSPASFAGAEAPGTQVSIGPGSYAVSESGPAGYAASLSSGCTGSIALGETKTCTITNDDVDLPSSITVTKSADPTSLPEPGGNATFSVTVQNTSAVDSVTISSLTDDVYGNLDGKGTCDVPQTIAAGGSYSCSFTGAVSGNAGSAHTDVVTASGTDDDGNPVSGHDDATVAITDLPSSIAVTKSASPTSLPEPGGNATFSVTVQNTSAVDSVTISSLTDDVYGDLDGKGTCDVPQTLAAGASYSCSFSGPVGGNAGSSHTDVVTASGTDDDGNPVSDDDDATVRITDLESSITVTKSASPTSLPEPGGNATFSVTIQNTSAADSVTISSLVDDVYGNLDGKGTCDVPQTIAAGGSYSCSFIGAVSGNAGSSHKDEITASGTDDDGNPVSGKDDATVAIIDLPSSIEVTKSASPASIQEPGGTATFAVSVKNTSAVDSVTISTLTDNVYGNLDGKGTCDVPQTLAAGASYSCSFTGPVSGSAGSSHIDVVTASGTDDDENPVSGSDDATVTITAAPTPPPPPPAPPAPPVVKAASPVIDLSITKADRPDPVFVGASLIYTLTVRNAGPDTATNVRVADALPAATTFVSVTSSQGTCTGGRVVRCSLGSIARGGRALVTIVVRPTEPGTLINTATVVGNEPEPNTANNRASTPTLVKGPFRPPVATCPAFTVQPRSLSVGRRGVVKVLVTDKGRGVRGVRILVKGPGLWKAATTDGRGRVAIAVRPPRAGIAEIRMTNQPSPCSTRRIGVVGVFQPPSVTG